jgi:hypothetical protein
MSFTLAKPLGMPLAQNDLDIGGRPTMALGAALIVGRVGLALLRSHGLCTALNACSAEFKSASVVWANTAQVCWLFNRFHQKCR